MNAILPADFIAELERTIAGCPPDRCVRMLWRTTDLLVGSGGNLREHEIGAIDEVLIRLAERMAPAVLAQLSATLADVTAAPREMVRRLALHDDPAVAVPVLLTSQAISSRDLEAIAASRSEPHLLAIAGRRGVDRDLADVVLKHGGRDVRLALAKNLGAQFSEAGYSILVEEAERDTEFTKAIALRPGVPEAILRRLLSGASKHAEAADPGESGSATRAPAHSSPRQRALA